MCVVLQHPLGKGDAALSRCIPLAVEQISPNQSILSLTSWTRTVSTVPISAFHTLWIQKSAASVGTTACW